MLGGGGTFASETAGFSSGVPVYSTMISSSVSVTYACPPYTRAEKTTIVATTAAKPLTASPFKATHYFNRFNCYDSTQLWCKRKQYYKPHLIRRRPGIDITLQVVYLSVIKAFYRIKKAFEIPRGIP